MQLQTLPADACWSHRGARVGFEVAFFDRSRNGHRLIGHTTAQEGPARWSVGYDVFVDSDWRTVAVTADGVSAVGIRSVSLRRDGDGRWTVDGAPRPDLDDCVDVDFESSAMTNTLPLHRLDFAEGRGIDVPAAFVRADLGVERLEQRYTLRRNAADGLSFHYESSTFDFEGRLEYDRSGLILHYPGIADRVTDHQA